MVYDFQAKQIIAKVALEDEEVVNFQTHLQETKLTIYTVTNLHVLRKHSLEFDVSLSSDSRPETPKLVDSLEVNLLKLVKFKTIELQLDPLGKFVILVDASGKLKIILTRNFKTVRESKVGFGPVKTRLFKNFVISLSKDRLLSIFDVKKNKKHRIVDLTKYAGIDTQYFEFIILDDKLRYNFYRGGEG